MGWNSGAPPTEVHKKSQQKRTSKAIRGVKRMLSGEKVKETQEAKVVRDYDLRRRLTTELQNVCSLYSEIENQPCNGKQSEQDRKLRTESQLDSYSQDWLHVHEACDA